MADCRKALLVITTLGLSLFAATSTSNAAEKPNARPYVYKYDHKAKTVTFKYDTEEAQTMTVPQFEAFARAQIADYTVSTSQSVHGVQVEYFDQNGNNALWYQGNAVALYGKYRYKPSYSGLDICFFYYGDSYNPSTGKRGKEECDNAYKHLHRITSKKQGDVFGLLSGKLPDNKTIIPNAWPDGDPIVPPPAQ